MLYGTLCSGHHIYIPPQHPFPLTAIYKSDQEKMILLQLLRMSSIFINTYYKIFYNYKIIGLKCLVLAT